MSRRGELGFGRRYLDGSIWSAVCAGVTEEVGRKRGNAAPFADDQLASGLPQVLILHLISER
jgi:hypothetical protein